MRAWGKRATQEIRDEALDSRQIARLQPQALVHTKAEVFPETEVSKHLVKLAKLDTQPESDHQTP